MKRMSFWAAALLAVASVRAEAGEEAGESDGWTVGAAGTLVLPQGGSRMRHAGGASVRIGRYFSDNLAVEGEAAWVEDAAGLAVQGLWHWQGWSLYNDLFGYSRFDPFFTFGAQGWVGRDAGQVGPKAGVGACWHLTDDWALRADAGATLGLETKVEMVYGVSLGVQYSF